MTQWRISHKAKMTPMENTVPLTGFRLEPGLASEVARVFGKGTADYILGLSQGKIDLIVRLPTKVLARIMEYVGIEELSTLAPVCKRFQEVRSPSFHFWGQRGVES